MSEYKLTFLYKKGLDYKTRNFIALLILLALIIIASVLINRSVRDSYVELRVEQTKLREELNIITSQVATDDPLRRRLNELREELFLTDTIMPDKNNTTITLAYIFDIFRRYRNNFHFNYRLTGSGEVAEDKEVKFNRYAITGSAYVNLLYVLIDQFERQPAFYTIDQVELTNLQPEAEGKVGFNIQFTAFHTTTGTPNSEIGLRNLRERRLTYNIFYPRIYDPLNIETDDFRELLDISEIMLVGMTQERIFIRNLRSGNIEVLYEGDVIRYGSLEKIDWDKQEAVFRINPTGLSQEIRLKIQAQ